MKTNVSSQSEVCIPDCETNNKNTKFTCKLTSSELKKRKETVIASLRSQMLEKKELKKGYSYKFPDSDKILDELTEFIKTERECCDFFIFNLSINGDKRETSLEITGKTGVKEFIKTELEM